MAGTDRRKTTTVQKISLGIELGMALSLAGMVFAFGRNTERWDKVATEQTTQGEQLTELKDATSKVSGQVLQMASNSNMAAAEARIQVLEAKQSNNEQLLRELKVDMSERLSRIERKIDQQGNKR